MPEINEDIQERIQETTEIPARVLTPVSQSETQEVLTLTSEGQKGTIKVTRAKRASATKGVQTVKGSNVTDIVNQMEDKIKALKYIDIPINADIPTPLGKGIRDILLEYQKDISNLKNKYIQQLQKS